MKTTMRAWKRAKLPIIIIHVYTQSFLIPSLVMPLPAVLFASCVMVQM
jgi:hypothetical protein